MNFHLVVPNFDHWIAGSWQHSADPLRNFLKRLESILDLVKLQLLQIGAVNLDRVGRSVTPMSRNNGCDRDPLFDQPILDLWKVMYFEMIGDLRPAGALEKVRSVDRKPVAQAFDKAFSSA